MDKNAKVIGTLAVISGVLAFIPILGIVFTLLAIILGIIAIVMKNYVQGAIAIGLGVLAPIIVGIVASIVTYNSSVLL